VRREGNEIGVKQKYAAKSVVSRQATRDALQCDLDSPVRCVQTTREMINKRIALRTPC
jgi:hypothetical protein